MGKTNDIDAIKGYIRTYDRHLISQTLNSLDFFTDPDIRVIRNLRETMDLNKMVVEDGIRPLNTDVLSAKGKRKWTRRQITPRYGMKIFSIIPEDVRETFMSAMLAPGAKREPFAAWAWQQEFAKMGEELNNNFYLSKYHNGPTAWSASATYDAGDLVYYKEVIYEATATTTAGESPESAAAKWKDVDNKVLMDGPGTIIAKEITASALTPVTTGTYDDTDAYDAYMEVWNSIPEARKRKGLRVFSSYDSVQDLTTNLNKKFGSGVGIANADIEEGKSFLLKGTGGRLRVQPVTWMGSSRRIIMTVKGNLVVGTDQVGDTSKVSKVVETLHGYDSVAKFMLSCQWADLEELTVNDQA